MGVVKDWARGRLGTPAWRGVLAVGGAAAAVVSLSGCLPESLREPVVFGDVEIGTTSGPILREATNRQMSLIGREDGTTFEEPSTIRAYATLGGGDHDADFQLHDGCGGRLLSFGESCSLGVSFTPSALGPRNTRVTVRLESYRLDGTTATAVNIGAIRVSGTGVAPDTTAPTISIAAPVDASEVARGQVVPAEYACADEEGGSGLESCTGPVAAGEPIDTATLGDKTFTVSARDNRGNESTESVDYRVIDRTPPTIDLSTPAEGAIVTHAKRVRAGYACADEEGGSGIDSCMGDVPNGTAIDTSRVGPRTFTVTAADRAGNTSATTHSYSVRWAFRGFAPPLADPPAQTTHRAGAVIPVRFTLGGRPGVDVLAPGSPRSEKIACGSTPDTDGVEPTRWLGRPLLITHRSAARTGYLHLWKTSRSWAGTCRQLVVALADGSVHRADVSFR